MTTGLRNKLAPAREQVKIAYENGATLRQIAEVHGVSAGTVRNCLVELEIDLRPRGRRKNKQVEDPRIIGNVDEQPAPVAAASVEE